LKYPGFYKDFLRFEVIEHEYGAVRMKCTDKISMLIPIGKKNDRKFSYSTIPEFSFDLYADDIKSTIEYFETYKIKLLKPINHKDKWTLISDPDGLANEVIQK